MRTFPLIALLAVLALPPVLQTADALAMEATPQAPAASPVPGDISAPTSTTESAPSPAPPAEGGDASAPLPEVIDTLHREISHRILSTAEWMDSFFADENYVKEVNRTYVRLRAEMFAEERSAPRYKPAVDLRLALPQLEKKTHLVLSAEPAEPAAGAGPVRTLGERFGTTEQQYVTTALHYFFRTTPKESFLVRTGLQFRKLEPVIFLAPRYRILFPYPSWDLRFTQEFLWRSDSGWQTDTRFDVERPLPYDLFFRTTLDGVWKARDRGYLYSLSFSVRQPLDQVRALDYEWINSYETRPSNDLIEVALRVRYRRNFLREWLFFELAPQLRYPRDRNFDMTPGILFKLEMFFGRAA